MTDPNKQPGIYLDATIFALAVGLYAHSWLLGLAAFWGLGSLLNVVLKAGKG